MQADKSHGATRLARRIGWVVTLCAGGAVAGEPVVNPWLASSAYPISHHNAAQTDSTAVDGPSVGKKLTLADVKTVPLLWSSAPTFKNIGSGESH